MNSVVDSIDPPTGVREEELESMGVITYDVRVAVRATDLLSTIVALTYTDTESYGISICGTIARDHCYSCGIAFVADSECILMTGHCGEELNVEVVSESDPFGPADPSNSISENHDRAPFSNNFSYCWLVTLIFLGWLVALYI